MIELKKLLEGLPILVKDSESVIIGGVTYPRSAKNHGHSAITQLGWRIILILMDEYEEPKPAENPTWESGTPCAERGCEPGKHKFKVGDWFEWHDDGKQWSWNGPFQVKRIDHMGVRFNEPDYVDNAVSASRCRHATAPKEAKPDPFRGTHWNRVAGNWNLGGDLNRCICDLRDEVRRVGKGK